MRDEKRSITGGFPLTEGTRFFHSYREFTVNRETDKDAKAIRKLRSEGQSYGEIATELGRSKSDVYRVCMTLGCAAV